MSLLYKTYNVDYSTGYGFCKMRLSSSLSHNICGVIYRKCFSYGKILCMGIIVKNDSERSELQQRIAAELREKQLRASLTDSDLESSDIDPADSAYMEDLKPATTLSWAWLLIGLAIIGVIITVIVITN